MRAEISPTRRSARSGGIAMPAPTRFSIASRRATSTRELRRSAATALATSRGAHGFATVKRLVDTEKVPDLRRSFVSALGQTREPGTVEALRALLRDQDARIRSQAAYYFAQRGGSAVVPEVRKLIETETDASVKQQAVSGLARLPANDAVPLLIQIARTSTDPVVQERVSELARPVARRPRDGLHGRAAQAIDRSGYWVLGGRAFADTRAAERRGPRRGGGAPRH